MSPYGPYSREIRKSYLESSWERFLLEYPGCRQVGNQRDKYGIYAYIIDRKGKRYFFAAKNSQNGIDISCHERLVYEAMRCKMEILIHVNGNTYRFFAMDILSSKPRKNNYHGAVMLNFSILLGKNIKEIGRHRAPPSETAPTLFDLNHPVGNKLIEEFSLEEIRKKEAV